MSSQTPLKPLDSKDESKRVAESVTTGAQQSIKDFLRERAAHLKQRDVLKKAQVPASATPSAQVPVAKPKEKEKKRDMENFALRATSPARPAPAAGRGKDAEEDDAVLAQQQHAAQERASLMLAQRLIEQDKNEAARNAAMRQAAREENERLSQRAAAELASLDAIEALAPPPQPVPGMDDEEWARALTAQIQREYIAGDEALVEQLRAEEAARRNRPAR